MSTSLERHTHTFILFTLPTTLCKTDGTYRKMLNESPSPPQKINVDLHLPSMIRFVVINNIPISQHWAGGGGGGGGKRIQRPLYRLESANFMFFCRVPSSFAQGCRLNSDAINRCVWSFIVMICPQTSLPGVPRWSLDQDKRPYFSIMCNICDVTWWRHKMVKIGVQNSEKLNVNDWMTGLEATSVA